MPVDTVIAWLWILCATLVSATGLWLAYRRVGFAATLVYVGGIALLGASTFKVHPALVRAGLPSDVRTLQDELAALAAQTTETQRRLDASRRGADELVARSATDQDLIRRLTTREVELKADTRRLEQTILLKDSEITKANEASKRASDKLGEVQRRLAEAEADLTLRGKAIETLGAQLTQAKTDLDTSRSRLTTANGLNGELETTLTLEKSDHQKSKSEIALLSARLAALDSRIKALEQVETQLKDTIARLEAAREQVSVTVKSLEERLAAATKVAQDQTAAPGDVSGLFQQTQFYEISRLSQVELVEGHAGIYYSVRFKNSKTGNILIFPPRAFIMGGDAVDLRSAIVQFNKLILKNLPPTVSIVLFVKGRADGGVVNYPLPKGAEAFREIRYLPPTDASGTRFSVRQNVVRIDTAIQNEHLPNLRAAYLAQIVREVSKDFAPEILGNAPVGGANESERGADLIMFVKGTR